MNTVCSVTGSFVQLINIHGDSIAGHTLWSMSEREVVHQWPQEASAKGETEKKTNTSTHN